MLDDSLDMVAMSMSSQTGVAPDKEEPKEVVTIRQYFPETWLWNLEITNQDGIFAKREKVPDTITDWVLDAYCLSNNSGLAVADSQTLRVFQPFFTTINMPYSVIRGEIFPVKASVFNYEASCVPV
jgi:hypothetical protein